MTRLNMMISGLFVLASLLVTAGCGGSGSNGPAPVSVQIQAPQPVVTPAPPLFTGSGRDPGNYWVTDTKIGDLDDDGDLDFVCASWESVTVWMNDGDGNFEDSGQELSQLGRALALDDIDGDGDLDVIVGCDGPNQIWLNDGSGTFMESLVDIGEGSTECIALGDLDGDQDLDMILGSLLWLNDGSGNFQFASNLMPGGAAVSLALGDLGNDGDLDLFMGRNGGSGMQKKNQVFINDGSGNLTNVGLYENSSIHNYEKTHTVAFVDIDGDGDLDLLDLVESGSNVIPAGYSWKNDGNGSFEPFEELPPSFSGDVAVVGDIDGDGYPDIVFDKSILFNDGNGSFYDSGQSIAMVATSLALGDLDGDGDPDLIAGGDYQRIYENDGSEGFSHSGRLLHSSWNVTDIALGNLGNANDDDVDILLIDRLNPNLAYLQMWKNEGTSYFDESAYSGYYGWNPNYAVQGMALGNIDGDGDLDLAFIRGYSGTSVVICTNDGEGILFGLGKVLSGSPYKATCLAFGDVNGDTHPDLVVGVFSGPSRIFLNDGSGNFSITPFTGLAGGNTTCIKLADLDNDGDVDLVQGNYAVPSRIWWNDGNGIFPESTSFGNGQLRTRSLALGDLNGDGLLDIVEGKGSHGSPYQPPVDSSLLENRILLNQGAGVFADAGQAFGGKDTREVVLGDVDNDGDLDVVFGNYDVSSGVWWNDGGALFVDSGMEVGSGYTNSLALGDLDGDGDLDLVVGDGWPGTRIYINE